jgi:hypothetical protein
MPRLLTRGCTGLDVKELQAALNFHVRGPATPLATDGIFGPLTDARVRDFQKRAGVAVDGDVGPITVGALYRTLLVPVEAVVKRRSPMPVGRFGFHPGLLAQVGPGLPDKPTPSQPPQTQAAASEGYELESKLLFNPLAKPGEEHPLRLTLTILMPWPVFLPKPLKLDVEGGAQGPGKFELDAKLKLPFEFKPTRRLELKPYFFVGAGVTQDHFKGLNAGGGAAVRLKLLDNIAGSGVGLSLEADGGGKFQWDRDTGKTGVKGFFEGGFVLEKRF